MRRRHGRQGQSEHRSERDDPQQSLHHFLPVTGV
jgi:hypothetical protein